MDDIATGFWTGDRARVRAADRSLRLLQRPRRQRRRSDRSRFRRLRAHLRRHVDDGQLLEHQQVDLDPLERHEPDRRRHQRVYTQPDLLRPRDWRRCPREARKRTADAGRRRHARRRHAGRSGQSRRDGESHRHGDDLVGLRQADGQRHDRHDPGARRPDRPARSSAARGPGDAWRRRRTAPGLNQPGHLCAAARHRHGEHRERRPDDRFRAGRLPAGGHDADARHECHRTIPGQARRLDDRRARRTAAAVVSRRQRIGRRPHGGWRADARGHWRSHGWPGPDARSHHARRSRRLHRARRVDHHRHVVESGARAGCEHPDRQRRRHAHADRHAALRPDGSDDDHRDRDRRSRICRRSSRSC